MTRVKLDTPAFADQSVDTRTIKDGTIIAQDVSGSITNAKLDNSSITIDGAAVSLGGSKSLTSQVLLNWQALTVADGSTTLSAEAGKGYFLDTNAGVIEVFLPTSPSRGDTISLVDYSGTFATNKLIINTGGQNLDSTVYSEYKIETNNAIVELVYVDATKGWLIFINQAAGSAPDNALDTGGGYDTATFIGATGGTVTTSGNFKIHTFTGDGCFVVSSLGNSAGGPNNVSYLVVAGAGGGGNFGGGGGGGFREGKDSADSYSVSPLVAPAGLPVSVQTYPVTVGGGGSGGSGSSNTNGNDGSNSVFSTITSAGGGGGGAFGSNSTGRNGGSGGGGGTPGSSPFPGQPGGSGNTPPVSPPQGNSGGIGGPGGSGGGGGGGATAAGANHSPPFVGGDGGAGAPNSITGSSVTYAGGGGGGGGENSGQSAGSGGAGGGGDAGDSNPSNPAGSAGTANTGGGGGGAYDSNGGTGGKGIVVIRYKFQ